MRKITLYCCLLFLIPALGNKAFAQDSPKPQNAAKAPETPVHYYHLEFVVQETGADDKPTNSRSYSTTVSTDPHENGSIRAGVRIPIATGTENAASALVNTQFQYIDVGVNIDTRSVQEIGRSLSLYLTAEVSSVSTSSDPSLHQPVIRNNRWQAAILIPIGKPAVVFTSDEFDRKGSMRMVVTATPME